MVPKNFEIGDLVWAKMKGYPFWPGKVTNPPDNSKAKKAQHYIFFFGSKNYAWIPDENIEMHDRTKVEKHTKNLKRFHGGYLSAVEEIESLSKNLPKYDKDADQSSEVLSKVTDTTMSSGSKKKTFIERKKKSPEKVSGEKRKTYEGKVSAEKAVSKKSSKRMSSFFEKGNYASLGTPQKEDYSELIRNTPPNNAYSSELLSSYDMDSTVYDDHPESPFTQNVNEFSKSESQKVKTTAKKIGFLGLGNMGKRIVKNLVESGHSLMVWNKSPDKYEEFKMVEKAETAADVIRACDITFSCMANEEVAKSLVQDELAHVFDESLLETPSGDKKGFVELTSLDPETSMCIDQIITVKGGRYLEAQVTGTWEKAETGNLFILTAGDNSLFKDCESCFCSMAKTTLYLSPDAGIACKLNIVQNTLLGTSYAAMAESLALIEPIGLGASDFLEILSNGPINSQDIINKGHAMIDKNSETNMPLKYVQRNIVFALELSSKVEQPMHLATAANQVYKRCKLLDYGDKDVSAVFNGLKY